MTAVEELAAKAAEAVAAAFGQYGDDADAERIIAAAIREALREPLRMLAANVWMSAETYNWLGPCDHDVGMCHCDVKSAMDGGVATLAKWGDS